MGGVKGVGKEGTLNTLHLYPPNKLIQPSRFCPKSPLPEGFREHCGLFGNTHCVPQHQAVAFWGEHSALLTSAPSVGAWRVLGKGRMGKRGPFVCNHGCLLLSVGSLPAARSLADPTTVHRQLFLSGIKKLSKVIYHISINRNFYKRNKIKAPVLSHPPPFPLLCK